LLFLKEKNNSQEIDCYLLVSTSVSNISFNDDGLSNIFSHKHEEDDEAGE